MGEKTRKVRYRLMPPEYVHIPEGKEALAERIAAQRQRLLKEFQNKKQGAVANLSEADVLMDLVTNAVEAVPAHTVKFVKEKPILSILACAGVLIAVPWVFKNIGAKRLMRGVNTLSPLLMDYWVARHSSKQSKQ